MKNVQEQTEVHLCRCVIDVDYGMNNEMKEYERISTAVSLYTLCLLLCLSVSVPLLQDCAWC